MSPYEGMIADIRMRGYRITLQREMIIESIADNDYHLSAEEIFEKLQVRTGAINIAAVYRTLDMLCEEGFARRKNLSEVKKVYATMDHFPHIHLMCWKCKRIFDSEPNILDMLDKELVSNHGFTPDLGHMTVFGICAECKEDKTNNV